MTFLELTSGFLMLTAMVGQGTTSAQSTSPTILVDRNTAVVGRLVDQSKREEVSQYVKEYFSEAPIMAEVARCESTYRHLNLSGDVLRGNVNTADVGVMQINERYHGKQASDLGVDIYTLEGNLAYAKYLYEKEGLRPWRSSAKCWNQSLSLN